MNHEFDRSHQLWRVFTIMKLCHWSLQAWRHRDRRAQGKVTVGMCISDSPRDLNRGERGAVLKSSLILAGNPSYQSMKRMLF